MIKNKKGFTLIELLVVVAIIGLLATVVLVATKSSRAKSADAAIKQDLTSLRNQAEIIFSQKGCYMNTKNLSACSSALSGYPSSYGPTYFSMACSTVADTASYFFRDPKIVDILVDAKNKSGSLASCSSNPGGTAWAAAVVLKSDNTKAFCVDSTTTNIKIISSTTPYTNQADLDVKILNGSKCS